MDRTYVIGFWQVAENPKRTKLHYVRSLYLTLRYLAGERIVFISDSADLNRDVGNIVTKGNGCFHGIRMPIDALEKYRQGDAFLEAVEAYGTRRDQIDYPVTKDKGENHFNRDYVRGTPSSYRAMLTIWHSKFDLLSEVSRRNPFDSAELCWTDASVSRFAGRRDFWDFKRIACRDNKVSLYPNKMTKFGRVIKYNASVLLTSARHAPQAKAQYDAALSDVIGEPYPNDEETIIDEMTRTGRDVFADVRPNTDAARPRYRYHGITGNTDRLVTRLRGRSLFLQSNPLAHCAYFK